MANTTKTQAPKKTVMVIGPGIGFDAAILQRMQGVKIESRIIPIDVDGKTMTLVKSQRDQAVASIRGVAEEIRNMTTDLPDVVVISNWDSAQVGGAAKSKYQSGKPDSAFAPADAALTDALLELARTAKEMGSAVVIYGASVDDELRNTLRKDGITAVIAERGSSGNDGFKQTDDVALKAVAKALGNNQRAQR